MVLNSRFSALRAVCTALLFIGITALPVFAQDVPVNTQAPKARAGSAVYIVQMVDLPVVAYTGGVPGYSATAPGRGQKINPADADVVRYAAASRLATQEAKIVRVFRRR